MSPTSTSLFLLLTCLTLSGCGSSASQDISALLEPIGVKTGWFDAGVEAGKNKLVPTIILSLKNVSDETVSSVQVNAVIRRVGETEEWGGAYVARAIGTEGLAPGASTRPIVLRSNLGYTGIETRSQMLKNSQFVDARVQVFAKHGGNQWAKLGEWAIARELLTQ
jgi:hypothetical protein